MIRKIALKIEKGKMFKLCDIALDFVSEFDYIEETEY
jgi:hypothetical protein